MSDPSDAHSVAVTTDVHKADRTALNTLIRKVRDVEADRAHVYATFGEGFNIFAETKDGPAYQRLCAGIAEQFQALSQQMIALEASFIEINEPQWAERIRTIQQYERQKLLVKVSMYKLDANFTVLSDQFLADDYTDASREQRRRLHEISAALNDALDEFRYAEDDTNAGTQEQEQA